MKKLIFAFAVMFLLSGCAQKDERVNIQFSSWGSKTEVEIIKGVISDFETQNSDIKVEFLHIPQNYFPKIHLLFASNTEPDVLFLNNQYLPIYAQAGKLEPLNVDESVYYDNTLGAARWNEILYMIPRDISILAIYCNKDLFKKAGVNIPKNFWTFEEFLNTARSITAKTNAFGVSFEEKPLYYLPFVLSDGGSFFKLESAQTQKALNFYADLRGKHHVAPRRSESASATMAQMFLQGKIGMYISGRWMTPKITEDANFSWCVVPLPAGDKGVVVPVDSSGWAISKNSKHKNEARRFVDYLASKDVSQKFADTGLIVPARNDVNFSDSAPWLYSLKNGRPTEVSLDYSRILDKLQIKFEGLFNKE